MARRLLRRHRRPGRRRDAAADRGRRRSTGPARCSPTPDRRRPGDRPAAQMEDVGARARGPARRQGPRADHLPPGASAGRTGTGPTSASSCSPSTATPSAGLPQLLRQEGSAGDRRRAAARRHRRRRARAAAAGVPGRPDRAPGPHPARHRRRQRGHRPAAPLPPAGQLRHPVQPEQARAADRPHRPLRPGARPRDPPLRRHRLAASAVDSYEADLEFLVPGRAEGRPDGGGPRLGQRRARRRRAAADAGRASTVDVETRRRQARAAARAASTRDVPRQVRRLREQLDDDGRRAGHHPGGGASGSWTPRWSWPASSPLRPHLDDRHVDDGLFDVPPLTGSWQRATAGLAAKLEPPTERHGSGPITFDPAVAAGAATTSCSPTSATRWSPCRPGCCAPRCRSADTGLHRVTAVVSDDPALEDMLVGAYSRFVLVGARRRPAARGGAARRRLDARAAAASARLENLGALARRSSTARSPSGVAGTAARPAPAGRALAGRPRRPARRDRLADERPAASRWSAELAERAQDGAGAHRRPTSTGSPRTLRAQARRGRRRASRHCSAGPRSGRAATSSRSTAATGGRGPSASTGCRSDRERELAAVARPLRRPAAAPLPGGRRLRRAATGGRADDRHATSASRRPSTRSAAAPRLARAGRGHRPVPDPAGAARRPGRRWTRSTRPTRDALRRAHADVARRRRPRGSAAGSSSCCGDLLGWGDDLRRADPDLTALAVDRSPSTTPTIARRSRLSSRIAPSPVRTPARSADACGCSACSADPGQQPTARIAGVGVGGDPGRPAGAAVPPPRRRARSGHRRPLVGAGLGAARRRHDRRRLRLRGLARGSRPGRGAGVPVAAGAPPVLRRARRRALPALLRSERRQPGGGHRGPRRAGAPGGRAAGRRDRPGRRSP